MNPFNPSSPKLTELVQKRETLKTKSKASQAEATRLNKLLHPQWLNETVIRVTDADPPTTAFIGIKPRPDALGVVSIGGASQHDDARKQEALERTLAGHSLADTSSIQEQRDRELRQVAAFEDAIEFVSREIEQEKNILADEYAKSLGLKHQEQMAALCKAMFDVHTKWTEVYNLKRHLIDSGVGLRRGLCGSMPEFLGSPNDPYNDMAGFFAAAKRQGYIREVPQTMQLKAAR